MFLTTWEYCHFVHLSCRKVSNRSWFWSRSCSCSFWFFWLTDDCIGFFSLFVHVGNLFINHILLCCRWYFAFHIFLWFRNCCIYLRNFWLLWRWWWFLFWFNFLLFNNLRLFNIC